MSVKSNCWRIIKLYDNINKSLYLCGLSNFCVGPVKYSKTFLSKYDVANTILTITTACFTLLLLSAFVTQGNLTMKQQADLYACNLVNPFTHFYCLVFLYHRTRLRTLLYRLLITLKEEYNNLEAERLLFSKLIKYMIAYISSAIITYIFFGISGILQVRSDLPFVTIITGWPDVNEVSTSANVARLIFYLYWSVSFLRLSGGYMLLLSMVVGISSQYRNLQKYFLSLNEIFEQDLSQEQKETDFEQSFVKGVKMHVATIWCTNECKTICKAVFDAQMLLAMATFLLSSLPVLVNPDRSIGTIITNLPMSTSCLTLSAFVMWNAGYISIEASGLPYAMFSSGWHNCCGASSGRVRKMVTISMAQAQVPIQLKALGCIELSYETFLGILKASHSLFSGFY